MVEHDELLTVIYSETGFHLDSYNFFTLKWFPSIRDFSKI